MTHGYIRGEMLILFHPEAATGVCARNLTIAIFLSPRTLYLVLLEVYGAPSPPPPIMNRRKVTEIRSQGALSARGWACSTRPRPARFRPVSGCAHPAGRCQLAVSAAELEERAGSAAPCRPQLDQQLAGRGSSGLRPPYPFAPFSTGWGRKSSRPWGTSLAA